MEIIMEQTDGWEATVTSGTRRTKAWKDVTERERGWIEGVFASGRGLGRQGNMCNPSISRNVPDTPYKLRELLGGQVKYRKKKHAYIVRTTDGACKDKEYVCDEVYCYDWTARGPDFSEVMGRLRQLNLFPEAVEC